MKRELKQKPFLLFTASSEVQVCRETEVFKVQKTIYQLLKPARLDHQGSNGEVESD